MSNKFYKKVVLLSIFVFLLITCSKKQEVKKVIKPENEKINTKETNITNEAEINNNVFGYRGIPNYYYTDIEELLLEKNEKEVDNVFDNPFYFGGVLEYLSYIKIDIDSTEGDTWFSSWYIGDSTPSTYNWLYLHIIIYPFNKDNDIKTYRIPVSPYVQSTARMLNWGKFIQFPILRNLPGLFYPDKFYHSKVPGTYLYDVNEDGFDEIIWASDLDSGDYPGVELEIIGFDRDKDEFVSYLDIITITIDEETGPEPIQYIQNQDVRGFRCLMDKSKYTSLYGVPATENENLIWVFFTWDSNERKYIEKRYIE